MELRRVVITGAGTINPLGNSVAEFWENLKNGVSGAGPITRFDASKHKTQFACEVKNFDPSLYMDKKRYANTIYIHNSRLAVPNRLFRTVVWIWKKSITKE